MTFRGRPTGDLRRMRDERDAALANDARDRKEIQRLRELVVLLGGNPDGGVLPVPADYRLDWTVSADRTTNLEPLDGGTTSSATIFIRLIEVSPPPDATLTSAEILVNGTPVHTENVAPWDLPATDVTTGYTFAAGSNTVVFRLTFASAVVIDVPATFTAPAGEPPVSSFAGPGTVGYGLNGLTSSLTVHSGNYTLAAGASISDLDITGVLTMGAGSTATNCRIRKWVAASNSTQSPRAVLNWCSIGPRSQAEVNLCTDEELRRSMAYGGLEAYRCDIGGNIDGTYMTGGTIIWTECWAHGFYEDPSDPFQGGAKSHCDVGQLRGGSFFAFDCRLEMIPWTSGQTFDQWAAGGAWPLDASVFGNVGQPDGTSVILAQSQSVAVADVVLRGCRLVGYLNSTMLHFLTGSVGLTYGEVSDCEFDPRGIPTTGGSSGTGFPILGSAANCDVWTGNTMAVTYRGLNAGDEIVKSKADDAMGTWS